MNDILVFWLDKGVDGFSMDSCLYIFEDEELRDEPASNNPNAVDEFDWLSLDHMWEMTLFIISLLQTHVHSHTYNLEETRTVALEEFFVTIKGYALDINDGDDRLDMLEVYEPPESLFILYRVSDFPFNMGFIEQDGVMTDLNAENVEDIINDILANDPIKQSPNWVVSDVTIY